MKYECGTCNSLMVFQGVEDALAGALKIGFGCPSCGQRVFLIANSQEAQLVKSMGITLGRVERYRPLGLVRSTLSEISEELAVATAAAGDNDLETETAPAWDGDAEQRLERAPAPVRKMARAAIERYAREKGFSRITLAIVAEAREKLGF